MQPAAAGIAWAHQQVAEGAESALGGRRHYGAPFNLLPDQEGCYQSIQARPADSLPSGVTQEPTVLQCYTTAVVSMHVTMPHLS